MDDNLGPAKTGWRRYRRINTDKHRGKSDKGMQGGNQLRHAGHLDPSGDDETDDRADDNHGD